MKKFVRESILSDNDDYKNYSKEVIEILIDDYGFSWEDAKELILLNNKDVMTNIYTGYSAKKCAEDLDNLFSLSIKENLNEGFAVEGDKLDSISSMLGYDDFAEFIGDNSGCFSAITEWIDQYFSDQIAKDMMEEPERLEKMGLYGSAEKVREKMEEDEDDIETPDVNPAGERF